MRALRPTMIDDGGGRRCGWRATRRNRGRRRLEGECGDLREALRGAVARTPSSQHRVPPARGGAGSTLNSVEIDPLQTAAREPRLRRRGSNVPHAWRRAQAPTAVQGALVAGCQSAASVTSIHLLVISHPRQIDPVCLVVSSKNKNDRFCHMCAKRTGMSTFFWNAHRCGVGRVHQFFNKVAVTVRNRLVGLVISKCAFDSFTRPDVPRCQCHTPSLDVHGILRRYRSSPCYGQPRSRQSPFRSLHCTADRCRDQATGALLG